MWRFAVVLLLINLTACSNGVVRLYEGEPLASEQSLRIMVPGELDIISINDQRVSGVNNLFSVTDRILELQPGEYRISAFYHNVFEQDADIVETIKTRPALFIVKGGAGEQFRLGFSPPADLQAARAMRDSFSGWSSKIDGSERRDTELTDRVYRQFSLSLSGGPAASHADTVAPYTADSVNTLRKDLIERLKANWQQASPQERQQFLHWLESTTD